MPLMTMASAASRITLSFTRLSQKYQLFQPISGVKFKVSPQTMVKGRCASPRAFRA